MATLTFRFYYAELCMHTTQSHAVYGDSRTQTCYSVLLRPIGRAFAELSLMPTFVGGGTAAPSNNQVHLLAIVLGMIAYGKKHHCQRLALCYLPVKASAFRLASLAAFEGPFFQIAAPCALLPLGHYST